MLTVNASLPSSWPGEQSPQRLRAVDPAIHPCVRNTHAVRFTRAAQNLTSMLATLSRKGPARGAGASRHAHRINSDVGGRWASRLKRPGSTSRVRELFDAQIARSDKIVTAVRIK